MTIERLLEFPLEAEKLTDAELKEVFKDCLNVTRPELATKPDNKSKSVYIDDPHKKEKLAKKAKANDILQQLGIDLKV